MNSSTGAKLIGRSEEEINAEYEKKSFQPDPAELFFRRLRFFEKFCDSGDNPLDARIDPFGTAALLASTASHFKGTVEKHRVHFRAAEIEADPHPVVAELFVHDHPVKCPPKASQAATSLIDFPCHAMKG